MPGPLTKSVCVLYLTFSRANSMLCLPSAQRPAGMEGRLPAGGGSRASHRTLRPGPQGWAGLAYWGERVGTALSIPWGCGSAGLRGPGMAAGTRAHLGLCRCLRCLVRGGPHPALCSEDTGGLCVLTAPNTWGAGWCWHSWGTPHAELALGADSAVILAVVSVQRQTRSPTAAHW